MYFSNGEVKECWEDNLGFKINNELEFTIATISDYKDKEVWDKDKQEHIVDGKDLTKIKSCVIEANQETINNYMYKLGIFNENVEVNRTLIEDKLQSNFESTISHLASSISMLEHTITQMQKDKQEVESE